jgi:hypothetical protein
MHGMQKVRGSNPLSSTQVRGQLDYPTSPFFMPVPQPVPQRPYAAVCEYPSSRAHAITFQPHGLTVVAAARQAWGSAPDHRDQPYRCRSHRPRASPGTTRMEINALWRSASGIV